MMRLLIVDDNAEMRRLVRSILRTTCNPIFECDDGAQALEAYQKHLPEWVLMDINMREKDGLTATREICAEFPEAKIVIVTKYNSKVMREAAKSAGATDYVLKENLYELHEILSQQKRAGN